MYGQWGSRNQIQKRNRADMKIYLASASPRRKELLKQVGISFKTMPSTVEEKITKTEPDRVVEELSYQKAVDVCGRLTGEGMEDFENQIMTVRVFDGRNYSDVKKAFDKVKKECYASVQ